MLTYAGVCWRMLCAHRRLAHLLTGPHTAVYVSSYYYICVLIQLQQARELEQARAGTRAREDAAADDERRVRRLFKEKTPQYSLNKAFLIAS